MILGRFKFSSLLILLINLYFIFRLIIHTFREQDGEVPQGHPHHLPETEAVDEPAGEAE